MSGAYALFGLVVDCDVVLDNARPSAGPADVVVRVRDPAPPSAFMPTGRAIASLRVDEQVLSELVVLPDGRAHLRVHGIADFLMELETGRIDCVPQPASDPGYVPILITGLVLSCYLLLQGHRVLHASAVQVDEIGGAIALLGSSGMGKSTVATMLAAGGGRLVSDDVLRLDPRGDDLMCVLGVNETRLRPKARPLAQDGQLSGRETADGRLAVAFPLADTDVPLRAVVIPGPSRASTHVSLQRLSPVEAIMAITQHPRVLGWTDAETAGVQFRQTGDLVRRVPVFSSRLPWGPPFPPSLGGDLVSALKGQLDG